MAMWPVARFVFGLSKRTIKHLTRNGYMATASAGQTTRETQNADYVFVPQAGNFYVLSYAGPHPGGAFATFVVHDPATGYVGETLGALYQAKLYCTVGDLLHDIDNDFPPKGTNWRDYRICEVQQRVVPGKGGSPAHFLIQSAPAALGSEYVIRSVEENGFAYGARTGAVRFPSRRAAHQAIADRDDRFSDGTRFFVEFVPAIAGTAPQVSRHMLRVVA